MRSLDGRAAGACGAMREDDFLGERNREFSGLSERFRVERVVKSLAYGPVPLLDLGSFWMADCRFDPIGFDDSSVLVSNFLSVPAHNTM